MSDFINELMNNEAVYRTAPATPGLLKIQNAQFQPPSKPRGPLKPP